MSLKKTVKDNENAAIRAELTAATLRAEAAERQAETAIATLEKSRKVAPPRKLKVGKAHSKGDFVEVVVGDIHGNQADPLAMAAFLADLKAIQPDRLILGGDIINCGGFLAEHHTLGYVAESTDSYFDDIAQTNHWLDEMENAACPTERVYIMGNHEHRVERWVLGQKLAHHKDIDFLRRQFDPELVLNLKARGYDYIRRDTVYDTCGVPGWVKKDKVFFAHDMGLSKNAASAALSRASANVVFFHTHRADFAAMHLPGSGLITAWNPGCMCRRQPLYMHTNPSSWTHGYLVRFISRSTGNFQTVHIIIDNGVSYGGAILHK
jgi:hypothetical protein